MTMAMFQAQLNTMVMWFDQWNESGQTVALFKMLTRLAPTQARFVSIALEHSLNECAELALREKEANNPGFVSGLLCESKEVAMGQALVHLPLLRPGNTEAKHCYLALIPSLLSHTVDTGLLLEEARQLLSYALIHPALRDDRKIFEPWRRSLGERIMTGNKTGLGDSQTKTRRSNSLTPPFAVTPNAEWTSQDDLSVAGKVRRLSLSSEQSVGPPLSPQSSQASSGSGSETHLDTTGYEQPGMKDMRGWLKCLRLHKYWRLFSQMSYEQMLSLNDDNFESVVESAGGVAVTKGARRKIILSIAKLRERSVFLALLEQEVMAGGNLMTAMDELKNVFQTPIKAYPEEAELPPPYDDIPSQFTRVLGKVCTQLMVARSTDEEALNVFVGLLDAVLHHEAFTPAHKKKITSWRLQTTNQLRLIKVDCGKQISDVGQMAQTGVRSYSLIQAPRSALKPPSPQTPVHAHQSEEGGGAEVESEPEINSRLESLCLSMTEHALGGLFEI